MSGSEYLDLDDASGPTVPLALGTAVLPAFAPLKSILVSGHGSTENRPSALELADMI